MKSNTEPKKIRIHILPNISRRNKGSQIMKFGQLIEYKMKNIFLEKLYTKCGEENSSRSFHKKMSIFLEQQSEILKLSQTVEFN